MLKNNNNPFIYVYGTLRKNQSNFFAEKLSSHAFYVGEGQMAGQLYDLGTYPGAIHSPQSTDYVIGDVYQINKADLLLELDRYEGIDESGEYHRQLVNIITQQSHLDCWAYILKNVKDHYMILPSGDWIDVCNRKG